MLRGQLLDWPFRFTFAGEIMADATAFQRFNQFLCKCPGSGVQLDLSKSGLTLQLMASKEADVQAAFEAMSALEGGAISNPDEQRMVGHYWLRAPSLAPEALQSVIQAEIDHVKSFAEKVHNKEIAPPGGGRYTDVLIVGIGGSALGPQLLSDALGGLGGKRALLKLRFWITPIPTALHANSRTLAPRSRARWCSSFPSRVARPKRATACSKSSARSKKPAWHSPNKRSRSRAKARNSMKPPRKKAGSSVSRCGIGLADARALRQP